MFPNYHTKNSGKSDLAFVAIAAVLVAVLISAARILTTRSSTFPVGSLAAAEEEYHRASSDSKESLKSLQLSAAKLATANADPTTLPAMLEECVGELNSLEDAYEAHLDRKDTLAARSQKALTAAEESITQMAMSAHRTRQENKLIEEQLRYRQLLRDADKQLSSMAAIINEGRDLRLLAESSQQLSIARTSNDALQDLAQEVARKAGYFQQKASDFLAVWK